MTERKLSEAIGKRVRLIRTAMNLSQSELAGKVGCTGSVLCEIEKGHRSPSLALLSRLEAILGSIWYISAYNQTPRIKPD